MECCTPETKEVCQTCFLNGNLWIFPSIYTCRRKKYTVGKTFFGMSFCSSTKAIKFEPSHTHFRVYHFSYRLSLTGQELDCDAQHTSAGLENLFGVLETADPNFWISGGLGEKPSILLLKFGLFSKCACPGCSLLWQDLNQGRCLWETREQHLSPSVRSGLKLCLP